jgi:hypothetical protein
MFRIICHLHTIEMWHAKLCCCKIATHASYYLLREKSPRLLTHQHYNTLAIDTLGS